MSPASWQSWPPTKQTVGTRCKAAGLQRVPARTGHEARPHYARARDASRAGAAPRATGNGPRGDTRALLVKH